MSVKVHEQIKRKMNCLCKQIAPPPRKNLKSVRQKVTMTTREATNINQDQKLNRLTQTLIDKIAY